MTPFRSPGPIAASLGPLQLRWYGLLLASGALLALALAEREAARRGEDADRFLTTACVALAGGIIGARVYHVVFHWDLFRDAPAEIFAVWGGGVSILGGILGGALAAWLYTRRHALSLGRFLDVIAPGLALAQAIGRWGNFFNEEAFGRPTALPWGLYISPARRPPELASAEYFHPTFLYESLWDLGVFAVTFFLLRRRLAPARGALCVAYLGLYSLGRLPIEGLRLDSEMLGPYRTAQLLAMAALVVAAPGLPWLWSRRDRLPV